MTMLRAALADYLAVRRAMGFRLERAEKLLGQFVSYLDARHAGTVTIDHATAWVSLPAQASAGWLALRMQAVRGFAAYLHTLDHRHQVPPAGLFPDRPHRAVPYLYSGDDVAALMQAACRLRHPQRQATYQALIGLLAVTGLRIGEAIGLDDADIDAGRGMLLVRQSKSGTSRLVPLDATTLTALRAYQKLRDAQRPRPRTPALFTSLAGTRVHYSGVHQTFARLTRLAGLPDRPFARPRIHDLRHSMAVSTLLDWYRDGEDVHARLPMLSAMLGHSGPKGTYYYLHAAPELLALAGQRLAAWLEERP
jgi:integrase